MVGVDIVVIVNVLDNLLRMLNRSLNLPVADILGFVPLKVAPQLLTLRGPPSAVETHANIPPARR